MIDIEKAINEFNLYTQNYNFNIPEIELKYNHSFRVMNICENIAKSLELNEEKTNLAKLVGLLHDIARFEQFTKYHTFSDSNSVDHGDLGAEILKNNNFIRKFIKDDKYDSIIIKAVKNHNKFRIETNLENEENLFAKIVRDADKIDIYYETITIFYQNEEKRKAIEIGTIDDDTMEKIRNKEILKKEKKEFKIIDRLLISLCFVFDLNYKYSFEFIEKNDYINKILNQFDFKDLKTKERIEEIKEIINNYIKNNKG